MDASGRSEFDAIDRIARRLPSAPDGELWIGDDAALVSMGTGVVAVSTDTVVEGVHADLALTTLADFGWKALAVNVSDLAAMGCRATRAVVAVSGPPATDLDALYDGLAAAAGTFGCAIVGGNLTNAPVIAVTVTVLGDGRVVPPPVRRSGARPGDDVWVTGPLGAAAAARRAKRPIARPTPRIEEGIAARQIGATAMIDVSDGLTADLGHILDASRVGVDVDEIPVAPGATPEDARGGGEDYELVWCCPPDLDVVGAFEQRGLRAPLRLGVIVADATARPTAEGWSHRF